MTNIYFSLFLRTKEQASVGPAIQRFFCEEGTALKGEFISMAQSLLAQADQNQPFNEDFAQLVAKPEVTAALHDDFIAS